MTTSEQKPAIFNDMEIAGHFYETVFSVNVWQSYEDMLNFPYVEELPCV